MLYTHNQQDMATCSQLYVYFIILLYYLGTLYSVIILYLEYKL